MHCPIIIGHRCNSARIALLYRLLGVDAVEVDVRRGDTGEIIVGHGGSWVVRHSLIGRAASTLDYMLFSRDPLIARKRRLSSWLSTLTWTRHILIDLKDRIEIDSLASEIRASTAVNASLAFSTPRHDEIEHIKRALPGSTVLATIRDAVVNPVNYLDSINADGASIPLPLALEGYGVLLREAGFKVYVWTINDEHQLSHIYKVADAIITDAPWKIRSHLYRLCRTHEQH